MFSTFTSSFKYSKPLVGSEDKFPKHFVLFTTRFFQTQCTKFKNVIIPIADLCNHYHVFSTFTSSFKYSKPLVGSEDKFPKHFVLFTTRFFQTQCTKFKNVIIPIADLCNLEILSVTEMS